MKSAYPLRWRHEFHQQALNARGQKRTTWVLWLTLLTMVVEIVAGIAYGSMALLADGWHMGTHVAAFLITLFAYRFAHRHADNPAFTFGTGKVNVLAGFASAILLAVVALLMIIESVHRLLNPENIHFDQALLVAFIGLIVNVLSAYILGHDHHDHHTQGHLEQDHNLRAAYLHVLADVLTSLLAILALLAGRQWGWLWLDAVVGIIGAGVIMVWALGLIRTTSPILLDSDMDTDLLERIRHTLEGDGHTEVHDLHLWKVTPSDFYLIAAISSDNPQPASHYHQLLSDYAQVAHITMEIHQHDDQAGYQN